MEYEKFLTELAMALLKFGSPAHKIESQLGACAMRMGLKRSSFTVYPQTIICTFYDSEKDSTKIVHIKSASQTALGKLHRVHDVYKLVLHDQRSAVDATQDIAALIAETPCWGNWSLVFQNFCLSFLICGIAFGGSVLDSVVAGLGGASLRMISLWLKSNSTVFEYVSSSSARATKLT